jgi:hypothetical protein
MVHDGRYGLDYNYMLLVPTFDVNQITLRSRQGDGGEQHIQRAFRLHQFLLKLYFEGDLLSQANEPGVYQWGLSEYWCVHLCRRFDGLVLQTKHCNKAYQSRGIQRRIPTPRIADRGRISPEELALVQVGHHRDRLTQIAGHPGGPALG